MVAVHTESEKTSSCKYVKKRAIQLTIKLRIEEFEALMVYNEYGWRAEDVSSELAPRAVWKLCVYPSKNGSIYLYLTGPMKDNGETLDATCHLYLVDGSSKTDSIGRRTRNFGKEGYIWGGDVSHDRVMKALHADGSLLVAADIEFLAPDDGVPQCDADMQQWPTKFSEFYGDAKTSDCSIQIGNAAIPAHKSFLMACSPAFRAMFSNPSEESKSGVIEISDFPPEPVRALVRFCYQGFLDDATMDGDGAVEIFQLADKYLIDDLKATLEEHFINKRLSVGNVIEMAKLADMHSAPKLKKACTKLIAEEWDAVSESTDWKRLEEEMPELATELAEAATAKE